jgi:hypothetical protein
MPNRQHPANLLLRVVGLVGVSDALNRYKLRKMIARYKRIIPTAPEQVQAWNLLVAAQGWSEFYCNARFVEPRSRRVHRSTGGSALEWAGQLLPDVIREDYIEEWQAWLSDLQQAGEPWYRRLAELLVIVLVAAPRLAIICRLGPRRTVD